MDLPTSSRRRLQHSVAGYTLVEIMMVVLIIGILAALAIVSFAKAREDSRIAAFCNDLRLIGDSLEVYAMQNGDYPPDAMHGVEPPEMAGFLPKVDWRKTPLGGMWDWERNAVGVGAGVSVYGPSARVSTFRKVDRKIDDGDLTTGKFRSLSGRYTYIILM